MDWSFKKIKKLIEKGLYRNIDEINRVYRFGLKIASYNNKLTGNYTEVYIEYNDEYFIIDTEDSKLEYSFDQNYIFQQVSKDIDLENEYELNDEFKSQLLEYAQENGEDELYESLQENEELVVWNNFAC